MVIKRILCWTFAVILLSSVSGTYAASIYDTAAQNAAIYLENTVKQQDGSWGGTDNLKPLYTAEAVAALYAFNQRSTAYYAGITWLENHRSPNVDYTARRIMALQPTKNDLSTDFNYLTQAQSLTGPSNNGWGVAASYQGSPLDTALSLQALTTVTAIADTTKAVAYLQATQLTGTDKGWPLAQETTSDATATAQAIIALVPRLGANHTVVTNAVNTLKTKVNTSSPVSVQALAARAYLTVNANSPDATPLLNNLKNIQVNGLIGNDSYTTALAIRAFALSAGKDLVAQRDVVDVPDQNLRNAINAALNKNALDNLNKGELANLIALDISGRSIKNLAGLEYAVNLVSLNASNNQIASTAPLDGLTQLTQTDLTGNPVDNPPVTTANADIPTLPEWGMILMAAVMLIQIARQQRNR